MLRHLGGFAPDLLERRKAALFFATHARDAI
jgi:hypothetical protein